MVRQWGLQKAHLSVMQMVLLWATRSVLHLGSQMVPLWVMYLVRP
jgi:hypothetical protein